MDSDTFSLSALTLCGLLKADDSAADCDIVQIMLCGIELQSVSNDNESQVVTVTRKQQGRQVLTETVSISSSLATDAGPHAVPQHADVNQISSAPTGSRKSHWLTALSRRSLCYVL